jgi:putative ATP-dependent endonuclease of OLD family
LRIAEAQVKHYRGWRERVCWRPGIHAVVVGPNNAGKTTLLAALNLVLDPYRDAYRDRLTVWDYPDCETDLPVEVTVILDDLSDDDRDHFEPYLEGRHPDGTFGSWDSPEEEFDEGELVLRLAFCGVYGEPSRAIFCRPEADGAQVRQADKMLIGWHYVGATLDPTHELAFYANSVIARLFEREDLSEPLEQIRQAIEDAKGPLLALPRVDAARRRLESSSQRLGLAPEGSPLDLAVAGLSDRRVLQSLQLVLKGKRSQSHLPLEAHGRGVLRVLLLAAILQSAAEDRENLILAVEEPEQNLEPVNQRLVTRSLLLADDAGARQVLLTTHSAEVAGAVPLAKLHLVRDYAEGPTVRALGDVMAAEHKFFERHARSALVEGLYASAVVLVEGATERGGLPVLWAKGRPGDGLDEHRIELMDCESIDKMPSFVRFYRALGIVVIAVCDADKPDAYAKVAEAEPDTLLRWSEHIDWEGVLAVEAAPDEIAAALEECRATLGSWEDHADSLRACVATSVGASEHLRAATDIPGLLVGYSSVQQREAVAALLRGKSALDFKSPLYSRIVCEHLSSVPPTVAKAMVIVHQAVSGDSAARGRHDL